MSNEIILKQGFSIVDCDICGCELEIEGVVDDVEPYICASCADLKI